jgi:hypothetical protein
MGLQSNSVAYVTNLAFSVMVALSITALLATIRPLDRWSATLVIALADMWKSTRKVVYLAIMLSLDAIHVSLPLFA